MDGIRAGPTFALAFSPLDGSGSGKTGSPDHFTDLKLAVGSFVEAANDNHVTIVGLDHGAFAGWDDAGLAPAPGYGFVPLAKAPHLYPPTALAFSPPALSQNLQASGGSGPGVLSRTREMLATSSDCIRLWDFAFGEWGDAQGARGPGGGGGYVGDPRRTNKPSYRLMVRAHLANVSSSVAPGTRRSF